VSRELFLESIKAHILGLFDLPLFAVLRILHLNLVDNVQCATIVTLKVSSTKLPNETFFLNWSVKTLTNVADEITLLDLFKVMLNLLFECETVLACTHKFFNLGKVIFLTNVLVFLENLHASTCIT